MATVVIVGAGMMGSALAFPARENGNEVRLVGTHLDREIIETSIKTGRHPKFTRDFPEGVKYYQIEQLDEAKHRHELVEEDATHLIVNYKVGGIGSNSCGPQPLEKDRFEDKEISFAYRLSIG